MRQEVAPRDSDVIRRAVSLLQARLPSGWSAVAAYEVRGEGGRFIDAVIELTHPAGGGVRLVVECKRALVTSWMPGVIERLDASRSSVPGPSVAVLVSPYLSSSVRDWLDANDRSYIDATGNMRVVIAEPAIYLRDRGADRDPDRKPGRPRGTLRGTPAARVVRALADFRTPMTVRELLSRSRASTGATYRVLEFLEEEALITRGDRGSVETVRWRPLLERWSEDYSFQRDNAMARYLQPRGLPALLSAAAENPQLNYAVTGSLAAAELAPYAVPRLAMVYVDDLDAAAEALGLRPVESGANVLLAAAASDTVFDRTRSVNDVTYAAPSQVVVDLLTGPGRSPAEAQALLDWMESDESAWRT